jgi:hypothetical protein
VNCGAVPGRRRFATAFLPKKLTIAVSPPSGALNRGLFGMPTGLTGSDRRYAGAVGLIGDFIVGMVTFALALNIGGFIVGTAAFALARGKNWRRSMVSYLFICGESPTVDTVDTVSGR